MRFCDNPIDSISRPLPPKSHALAAKRSINLAELPIGDDPRCWHDKSRGEKGLRLVSMYETHFQLNDRPFSPVPNPLAYFPAPAFEAARTATLRCLTRAEGVAMIVGGPGLGKSLLARLLESELRGSFMSVLINSAGLCTRRSLLTAIAGGIALKHAALDEGDLRMAIVDALESAATRSLCLLVDEADSLPLRLMEELRLLGNIAFRNESRVRIGLIGTPRLEERLANSKLESLAQRIAARSYLVPFSKSETHEYLRRELFRCGVAFDRVFAGSAGDAVFAATDGIPRLVNQVCDHALVLAAVNGRPRIDAGAIQEAWADLQQLPAQWNESRPEAASVIEFGELSDSQDSPSPSPVRDAVVEAEASFAKASQSIAVLADEECLLSPTPGAKPIPEVELVFEATSLLSGHGFVEEEIIRHPVASPVENTSPPSVAKATIESHESSFEPDSSDEFPAPSISGTMMLADIDVRHDPFDAIAGKIAEFEASHSEPAEVSPAVSPYRETPRFDPATDPVYPSPAAQKSVANSPSPAPILAVDRAEELEPSTARPGRFGRMFTKLLKG